MGKCHNCKVEILDETEYCPLCRSILEQTDPVENMYPDIRPRVRALALVSRIFLFCAILAEGILFTIDLIIDSDIWWSALTGLAFFYIYTVLRYAAMGKAGYRNKIIVVALIGILVTIAVDLIIGYRGWSLDYAFPIWLLLVDGVIVGCMIFNRRNWQSYIMWQLFMILCSLLPVLLNYMELEHHRHLAFLPLAVSLSIFLGTMIIGDRRARTELKRRFHIN